MKDEEFGATLRRHFASVMDRTASLEPLALVGSTSASRRHHRVVVAAIAAGTVAAASAIVLSLPAPSISLGQIISKATQLGNQASTIHIVETYTITSPGPPRIEESVAVTTDEQPKPDLLRTVAAYSTGLLNGYYLTEVLNATTGFDRISSTVPGSNSGPDWFSFPTGGRVKHPAPIPSSSPAGLPGVSGEVAEIGTKTVDGAKVTGYSFTCDVALQIRQAKFVFQRDSFISAYQDHGVKSFPVQVWIDSSGRIREISMQATYPKTGTMVTDTQIQSYSNKVLHFASPSGSDVTAEPTEEKAFGEATAHRYAGS